MVPMHASYESEVLCNIRGFCFLGLGWGWHIWVCAQFEILEYRQLAVGPGTISSIRICLLLWLKESIPNLANYMYSYVYHIRLIPRIACPLESFDRTLQNRCQKLDQILKSRSRGESRICYRDATTNMNFGLRCPKTEKPRHRWKRDSGPNIVLLLPRFPWVHSMWKSHRVSGDSTWG